MGCCTNFAHFCRTVGVAHFLQTQAALYFMTPDRRVSRFQADRLPAPFHLARTFLRSHYLTSRRETPHRLGIGVSATGQRGDDDPPFADWLRRHGQTPRTIDRFWGLVLTSALNETTDRIGLKYARKVFVDGFLRHRRGFEVQLPLVPLGRLYGDELHAWLDQHGVQLQLQQAAKRLRLHGDQRRRRRTARRQPILEADWYVSAVPFDRLLDLLPAEFVAAEPHFRACKQLETSPITSVHLWYDRPVTDLPHVVLIDCVGQWVFNRGEIAPGEHYVQVVVSAARPLRGLGHEEVKRRVVAEMAQLFPALAAATFCADAW